MPRRTIFALALCALLAGGAAADDARLELEARLWDPGVGGTIRVIEAGVGTEIDLEGDLGLTNDAFTDLRLVFHPSRRTVIRLAAVPLEYTGDSVVSRTISFAGQTFTVSTRVTSDVALDFARAGFAWQFLSTSDGRFRVGPLLEVKGFRGDAALAGPDLAPPVSVAEDFEAAFGSAGLLLTLEPTDRVAVFGEFSSVVGADEGDQTDLELGVRVELWGALNAVAGYRSIEIQFEDGDDLIDFETDGAFFGVSFRF